MQKERQPEFDLLYPLPGFRYCDWLLAPAEQAAWQYLLDQPGCTTDFQSVALTDGQDVRRTEIRARSAHHTQEGSESQISDCLAEVERRATTTLKWMIDNQMSLLSIALDHLTLARVGLIRAILANPIPQPTLDLPHVVAAVNGLRAAGQSFILCSSLLTASLYHFVRGEHDLARKHLAEAQQIAERGPMPLFLADIHLHRARMFHDKTELAQTAKLIRTLAYGRRYDELLDAEQALS